MSLKKPGTSDWTDAHKTKYAVSCWQSRNIIFNAYALLKKVTSDYEHAKSDFLKKQN
jgi:hypothetical protein